MKPSILSMSFYVQAIIFANACRKPQEWFSNNSAVSLCRFSKLQIKNIKLHIVTDIKVTINSIFDFRISAFGWGAGHYAILKKFWHLYAMTFQAFVMANYTVISDNS